jgi:hypothetical protein
MASIISAGNATNGLAVSSDNTGILELKTGPGAGTTALTISTAQAATFASTVASAQGTLYPLTSGTAVAATSGTSIDFTGIPAWVKRITVMFSGVSTNGTSQVMIQIGDSGGVETTGYVGSTDNFNSSPNAGLYTGVGYEIEDVGAAANVRNGNGVLTLIDASTNTWTFNSLLGFSNAATLAYSAGSKSLSATLDRVRITTVGGTNTFDAGTINILYE